MSGDADSQATGLVGVLARSRELGFLGPGPLAEQIGHSRAFGELVRQALGLGELEEVEHFLDLGAGGGLPGLVLLDEWPSATAVLIDAQERRCRFLAESLTELGWQHRAEVRCGRAEVLGREPGLRGRFGLVVARGFGPPAVTAECAVGFLSPGGLLAVTEPPTEPRAGASSERWPQDGLRQLGFGSPTRFRSPLAGAACLKIDEPAENRWPRRDGVPGKRPLW
jgi:16S rRNA (guanine527-N7)-methyltransferase